MPKKLKSNRIPMALLQLYQGGDVIIADGKVVRVVGSGDLPNLAGSHQKWFLDPVVVLLHPGMNGRDVRTALSKIVDFYTENADDEVELDAHHFWQW